MGIIRENINFEKGLDPKTAMGIGLKPEIVELRHQLSKMLDESRERNDNPFFGGRCDALEDAIFLIDKLSVMKNGNS